MDDNGPKGKATGCVCMRLHHHACACACARRLLHWMYDGQYDAAPVIGGGNLRQRGPRLLSTHAHPGWKLCDMEVTRCEVGVGPNAHAPLRIPACTGAPHHHAERSALGGTSRWAWGRGTGLGLGNHGAALGACVRGGAAAVPAPSASMRHP